MAPFANDEHLQNLVICLLETGCTDFIETGTYHGDTANYVARASNKRVYTCEIDETLYDTLTKELNQKVICYKLSSPDFLKTIAALTGRQPLFFLDAHWYDYWPLRDEINVIGEYFDQAIIIVHDFCVPDRINFFASAGGGGRLGTDHHRDPGQDRMPTIEYIEGSFKPQHHYEWDYPNYPGRWPGYVVIFQNVEPRGLEHIVDSRTMDDKGADVEI